MPAAVLPHAPHADIVVDWERDTDLFRIYANIQTVKLIDGESYKTDIVAIHLLDEALQPQAVINTAMFNEDEWLDIEEAAFNEWERMQQG